MLLTNNTYMKKIVSIAFAITMIAVSANAQTKKVSILGDPYLEAW